ncbi:MAG: PilZ domain-containing protein [Sandaracinaceae bacterium]|nr:PilZ domain-containing protein [Sandaracinaceae bacterium]MBP7683536.1 PilZ domain-containing protein [Deltaproteobacteria bacterium]MBK7151409.1 PilZ domain-containing protein [Sandaracinaceae bacterium]MBK7776186.1 PilZ domain-containing protein [Sandaracinaceae bacterium]MBK8407736.1 PilZ domain-containing protein [Sandaracinaceae bacterium]
MTAKLHARDKARAEVALRVAFQSRDGLEHMGTTRDLSVRGAFIETPQPPLEGATVALRIEAPTSWDPIVIACVVQWSSARPGFDADGTKIPPGFGVRFASLSNEHTGAIRALLAASGFDER